jgi:hypothetical protein
MLPDLTDNERFTLIVAAVGVVISLVTAGITALQLRTSVRQARHAATFEHLNAVRDLLRKVFAVDPKQARQEALAYYKHEAAEPTLGARAYLELLDAWDLLGIAYMHKLVDRRIVLEALRNTLRDSHTVSREFIGQMQEVCGPATYKDLDRLIACCLRPDFRERITTRGEKLHARLNAIYHSSRASTFPSESAGRHSGVQGAAATVTAATEVMPTGSQVPD